MTILRRVRKTAKAALLSSFSGLLILAGPALAEPSYGIAMYGKPALPPDFTALPYANPDAPQGGTLVTGDTGTFDSLNPFVQKGTPPWQLRFLTHESLMIRNYDEPFSLYGLLASSVETDPDRHWVEYTLNPKAKFSDGSPVTVEDVIWSYRELGTEGNARYAGLWSQIDKIEQTGPGKVRITFKGDNRELALIAGLTPILKKAQWQGKDFANAGLDDIPIGSAPYVISSYTAGRNVVLKRNPDYWGKDLPVRRGTDNFDTIRIEFYGDQGVLFEAFKAGELSFLREFNAEKWQRDYDFPAVQDGRIVKSEIPTERPSGMTGFVMNTRRAPFNDIRVRDAMMLAFNFEYINGTITGGRQPRITSYFSHSTLGMRPGPATGRVKDLLAPFADSLPPGALDGYTLPEGDGSARNRANLRRAAQELEQAGWVVGSDGVRRNGEGRPLSFDILLRQGDRQDQSIIDIYQDALKRLGITTTITLVDDAQYAMRTQDFDFDMTDFRRELSLSPGNEQRLYWGSQSADLPGSRNLMGLKSPAADAMIDAMLSSRSLEDFTAATRALDRVLTAGRYVIPVFLFDKGRIAHKADLKYPAHIPLYGDGVYFLPDVWWQAPSAP
ncbi:extracellular solute-binding protein [Pseudooceanicola sp. CBS1P-1]|uniref:ABC transporter substrate-binding protein n=1 Tax=Pseudooceanicola albus TaxID=2692189 RepID=A0A6L7FYN1_9RHOB|nr:MULTISPECIES: extracellular solute-binding protein [Pseudooceanicola]MBT9383241.1 extracellular solute-binding protein [Pseudooceanicola endophyticus]MXN16436.1 ABC transporter substrate-binding protein [Pseudooceanicola albus]